MQIAISGVEYVGHRQPKSLGNGIDFCQHLGQGFTRCSAVHTQESGDRRPIAGKADLRPFHSRAWADARGPHRSDTPYAAA